MSRIHRTCLTGILICLSALVSLTGQKVDIKQDVMDEAGIRSGGRMIYLSLSGDIFVSFTSEIQEDIVSGLSGSAAFEAVKSRIPLSAVERLSEKKAQITLPPTPGYYITTDDKITVTLPASALTTSTSPVRGSPEVKVTDLNTSIAFSGTLTGATESDVRSGGVTLVLTAEYNRWRAELATTETRAVKDMFRNGRFKDQVVSGLTSGDIAINSNVLTISFPVSADYYIGKDEKVTAKVSESMFLNPESLDNEQRELIVGNEDPEVALQDVTYSEEEIRAASQSFLVTLSGDKFISTLSTSKLRNDFSGGSGWESTLEPMVTFTRISDFQLQVTIPAYNNFNIDQPENVSVSLDNDHLQTTTSGSFGDPVNHVSFVPLPPGLTISSIPSPLNEENLDGATLVAGLSETRLEDLTVESASITFDPPIDGLVAGTPVNETSVSFQVPLSFSGDVAGDRNLTMILDGAETAYGSDLTSNTLVITASYDPAVTRVSIPNLPMGTSNVVTATIHFTDNDEPGTFTCLAGTIEGEPLNPASVKKINSTMYTATFIIREETVNRSAGQSIRVRGLQFASGTNVGQPFDYDIIQDNDEIDTRPPVVEYIQYPNGTVHRISIPVIGTVVADGNNYQFDHSRSSINGVSFVEARIQSVNNLDNTYAVTYTPAEGDPDVPPGSDLPVALVMIDRAGNVSSPAVSTLYMGYSPVIDANSPRLDSAVVMNPGNMAVGDQIEIFMYASENLNLLDPPIYGTHVNFVPISSPNLTFSQVNGNIYRLLYTVSEGDNEVGPGQMTFNLEMEDLAGNRANSNIPLRNNYVTIGSSLPTATLAGGGSVCEGDSIQATLHLTGEAPWDVVIHQSPGPDIVLTGISSPFSLWLHPYSTGMYTVGEVVDATGIEGIAFGQVSVTIEEPTPVNILLDRTTFLASEPGVELRADHEPGIFSGKGVSAGYFYPSIASPEGSPHRITYTYTNLYGCVSYGYQDVNILQGAGSVHLLSGEDTIHVLCDDAGTYEIRGSNREGVPGTFEIRKTNSSAVISGAITDNDLTDNTALFDPTGLAGGYDIIFSYEIDGTTIAATLYIRVDEVASLEITSVIPDQVCMNDEPYLLTGNMDGIDPLATYRFTGPGVTGSMSKGFYFDPGSREAVTGPTRIMYEYSTESGCFSSVSRQVNNGFVPDVSFALSTACIREEGDTVKFNNRTDDKHAVASWSWEFGDLNSGAENFSNLENPEHFYPEPGLRSIILTATTLEGCSETFELDTLIADRPVADFTWLSDCYSGNHPVRFLNRSEASFAAIESYTWIFKTEPGEELGTMESGPGNDTVSFYFTEENTYLVTLAAVNAGGCSGQITREIRLNPTIYLIEGYDERFDDTPGNWSVHSENGHESWTWGVPDFTGYRADTGDKGWYTDLPAGVDGYAENSWIQSPCFDFSRMERPMVQLDLMKSFVPNVTGAVLQYQEVIEEGWKTVGLFKEGIEWYNSNTIINRPGGSSFGWGLNVFEPDTDWKTSRHDLDMVAGRSGIKFRIIIGTTGQLGIGNQGLAVSNFRIAERTRRSVLEHFTNAMDASAVSADGMVDRYILENSTDVVDLQYHMFYPEADPMNLNNPDPPSTRAGILGVGTVPYALLNGGPDMVHRYDFSSPSHSPGPDELKLVSLEIPDFDVDLMVRWLENSLETDVTITCRAERYSGNLQLYVAVIESEVTAYRGLNNDTLFRNVVLDMLPTAAGQLLGNNWSGGKHETRSYSWEYRAYVEDVEDLGVIAFIQDRNSGKILQAADDYLTPRVGKDYRVIAPVSLTLFPNPAGEWFFVRFGEKLSGNGVLILADLSGKVMMQETILPGLPQQQFSISHLERGMYVVNWYENNRVKGWNKLIISR